ncbi:unnamed protein product [Effrenium voratum]|uniref:Pentatricopeptide repeat-containing protein, chloroplastic n=1 Tax=Effrenium voratum TaxID=2562239 RepID=A0AA36J9U4_9DINO|nr:unnamed protein product [Effrenium voratum]
MAGAGAEGCRPGLSFRCALLAACARKSRWREALDRLGHLHEPLLLNAAAAAAAGERWPLALALADGGADPSGRNAAAAACARLGLWQQASWLVADGLVPDTIGYSACFSGLAQREAWPEALHLSSLIFATGVRLDPICGNAFLASQAWQRAQASLRNLQAQRWQPNTSSASTILSCLSERSLWEMALVRLRGEHGQSAVNAGIDACDKGGAWRRARMLLHSGLEVDVVGFSSCQSAQGSSGDWPGALYLLQQGATSALRGNAVGLGAALGACREQWRCALQLQRWARRRLEIGFVARLALLSALEWGGKWRRALGAFGALEVEAALGPDAARAANCGVVACGRAAAWPWALRVLHEVEARRLPVTAITQQAALYGCEAALQPGPAVLMLQELNAMPNTLMAGFFARQNTVALRSASGRVGWGKLRS